MLDKNAGELEKAYAAQLKRRDSEIDVLRKHNEILARTAMKQSEKLIEMQELLSKIQKEKSKTAEPQP